MTEREYITPQIIDKCIEIAKKGEYDFDKYILPVADNAPCSVTQALFPEVIDIALQLLKRQARNSQLDVFIEWGKIRDGSPKYRDRAIVPLPIFADRKEQFRQ